MVCYLWDNLIIFKWIKGIYTLMSRRLDKNDIEAIFLEQHEEWKPVNSGRFYS